jgi:RNA polymerase sigma factor (sigma-70 family)
VGQEQADHPVAGLEQTVERVLRELQPRMDAILRHYQIPVQDAEDLIQEIFVSFVRQFRRVQSPEAWLTNALKYQCLLYWRKRRKQLCEAVDTGLLEILAEHETPAAERADRVRDVEKMLLRIPSRCRKILHLRYGLGFTSGEVACELGYQRSSVSNIVRRCVATLTAKLLAADSFRGPVHG